MKHIMIIHPEGNINNNPNLKGIVEILCDGGFRVDIYSPRIDNIDQSAPCRGAKFVFSERENIIFTTTAVIPSGLFGKEEQLLEFIRLNIPRYDLIIGIDRGIIEASILAKYFCVPYGLISYEILFSSETGQGYLAPDITASRNLAFAVCQDKLRSFHLTKENSISLPGIIEIPVAGRGVRREEKRSDLHEKLGISKDKKIALYIGSVTEKWSGIDRIIDGIDQWPEDWVLVVHQRYSRYGEEFIRLVETKKNLFISPFSSLPYDRIGELIRSADIGLGFYLHQEGNIWAGNNLKYIGMASGKVATYLQYGLPILINEIGEMSDHTRQYNLGAVVESFSEIPSKLAWLSEELLSEQSANCYDFFEQKLDLNRMIEPLTSVICRLTKSEDAHDSVEKPAVPEIRVSAIVSVYNSEKYIVECFEDLISQSLYKKGQMEIVVVNTGSQQNEDDIILQYQKSYPNIEYIRIDRRETVYQAWNRGIKVARGKYITNANTDDRHRYDALEIMADELDRNPEVVLVYANQYVTRTENERFDSNTNCGAFLWPEYDHIQLIHTSCCGPQPLWRKSLHDEFGYFHEALKVAGDYEWWLRISEKYSFKHIDQMLGLYLLSDDSIEHKENTACMVETRQVRDYYARRAGLSAYDYGKYSSTFLKDRAAVECLMNTKQPLVSVIVPTYNRPAFLKESIGSIIAQTYKNLEIIVVNDFGQDVNEILSELGDKRIKYIRHEQNKGLAAARNTGIQNSKGKYIAYLDDDDVFYPEHIETLVSYLETGNEKIAYTDAHRAIQKLDNGKYVTIQRDIPFSRDFSRDQLLYLNIAPVQCFMHEKAICGQLGLFEESLPAHEDWEYWLRLSRHYDFKHLPVVTSEFRQRTDQTNMTTTRHLGFYTSYRDIVHKYYFESREKPEIQNIQVNIMNNFKAQAEKSGSLKSGSLKSGSLRTSAPEKVKVSIIIPVFNKVELTRQCLSSLFLNTPREIGYEVIVVDNASTDSTAEYLAFARQCYDSLHVIPSSENLGFARGNNLGASIARGEFILCLNNDTEPRRNWLQALLSVMENDTSVGAVGSKLLFPDGTIQHAGLGIFCDKKYGDPLVARHLCYKEPENSPEANTALTFQALTGACLMIRKSLFDQLGGFDEGYWNGYEDVDLCYQIGQKGYKLVYQPKSVVIHYESQSGKERFSHIQANIDRIHGKWLNKIKPDMIIESDGSYQITDVNAIREYFPPNKIIPSVAAAATAAAATAAAIAAAPDAGDKKTAVVSIIVLTYNGLSYNREFFNSVIKHVKENHEIIVVDNASTDGTVEYLKGLEKKHSNIKVIYNDVNLGFPMAVNQAIKASNGSYVLIANNDIVVTEGWLERMLQVAESEARIGIVGPISNAVSGVQLDKKAKYKNMPEMHKYAKKVRKQNAGETMEFPRVAFLCTLIKREVIDAIGGLDERFSPGNYEDDDFCLRAQKAGYKAVIAKDVFIHHYGSKSFKAEGEKKYIERLKVNEQKFVNKWGATIEQIWLEGKQSNSRNLLFPLNGNRFLENYQRGKIAYSENDSELALNYLKAALEFSSAANDNNNIQEIYHMLNKLDPNNDTVITSKPKVSIIVLTWNRAEMLNECLGAVYRNMYYRGNVEVIVGDNGSTDHTQEVIEKYKPAKVIRSENNIGWELYKQLFAAAKGDYIIELDDDVLDLPEQFDKKFVDYFETFNDFGLLGLDVIRNDYTNGCKPEESLYRDVAAANGLVLQEGLVGGWCLCLRKEVFDRIGGFGENYLNSKLFEDGTLYNKIVSLGLRAGILKGEKCFHASGPHYSQLYGYMKRDIAKYEIANFEDGVEWYKSMQNEFNQNDNELLKAERFIEDGNFDEALTILAEIISREESNIDALNDLVVVSIMVQDYDSASDFLLRVLRQDPQNEVALGNLEYLEQIINTQIENAAQLASEEEQTQKAAAPASPYLSIIQKAEELIESGELKAARKMLETVIMMEPSNIDALNDMSVIEIMENNLEEAVNLIEKVILADPQNETARGNLDYLQEKLK